MVEKKKFYTSQEAVDFLNDKLHPTRPLDLARLARLRRKGLIHGERVGKANASVYTHKALEMVTLADLEDRRKIRA